jgi:hypothetical protein
MGYFNGIVNGQVLAVADSRKSRYFKFDLRFGSAMVLTPQSANLLAQIIVFNRVIRPYNFSLSHLIRNTINQKKILINTIDQKNILINPIDERAFLINIFDQKVREY